MRYKGSRYKPDNSIGSIWKQLKSQKKTQLLFSGAQYCNKNIILKVLPWLLQSQEIQKIVQENCSSRLMKVTGFLW